jgi:microcystin-dependent protein
MSIYFGEIRPFNGPLPEGWEPCDGRQLKASQNMALYALLGTRYGGDGTVFNLPDLRGRVTAGLDSRHDEGPGATSGIAGDNPTAIPYEVVNWGISMQGVFPNQNES